MTSVITTNPIKVVIHGGPGPAGGVTVDLEALQDDVTTKAAQVSDDAEAAEAAKTGAETARDETIAYGGAGLARAADEVTALQSTTWTKTLFQVSSTPAPAISTAGERWVGFDAGTDIAVGEIVDAVHAGLIVASTTTKVRVRIWEVATADAAVNSGPPQTNDVLVSDVTFTTLSAIEALDGGANGLTVNVAEREFVFPLTTPIVIKASKTYKVSMKALDNTDTEVEINFGYRTVTNPSRQRRNGGARATPGAGSFTNAVTTRYYSIGFLRRKLNRTTDIVTVDISQAAALSALSQSNLVWMSAENEARLFHASALYSRSISDNLTFNGDSLVANTAAGAAGRASDVVGDFISPPSFSVTASIASSTMTVTVAGGTITLGAQVSGTGVDSGQYIGIFQTGTGGTGTYTLGYSQATVGSSSLTITGNNNIGVSGTRTDEIYTKFIALPAAQKNDYGIVNGGTNDVATTASGVLTLTITSGGSGGLDGTYALGFSGGTNLSGQTIYQPTGTFTVSGGAVVSYSLTTKGGGYTTAPTVSTSACPGLTGAVLTPNIDSMASMKYFIGEIMSASSGNRIVQSPWVSNPTGSDRWSMVRHLTKWEVTTYGALAFDSLVWWNTQHTGSETGLASVRTGIVDPGLLTDSIHPDLKGTGRLGRQQALMLRALTGVGAPYIHHEAGVGAKNGDAVATAIHTPRVIGTGRGYSIIRGNESDQVRINPTTGAITRGAGTLPSISELFIEADSPRRGKSNIARIPVFRQMDGTSPQSITRVRGNGASVLTPYQGLGMAPSKVLTFVICARWNNTTNAGIIANASNAFVQKIGRNIRSTLRTSGSSIIADMTGTTPPDPFDFNLTFIHLDTANNIARIVTNELTAVSVGVNIADAYVPLDQLVYVFGSGGAPLINADIKFLWLAPNYLDITDSAVRALFYNPTTRAPLDLGAAGTVSGVTPTLYLRGMAGDYMLGKNYGSGGDLFSVPYINADNVGFQDIAA